MTAEVIANVVRDLKAGRIRTPQTKGSELLNDDEYMTKTLAQDAIVVDSTAVYDRWVENDESRAVYEDHRLCPPWENSLISYVNEHGNVQVLSVLAVDRADWTEQWDSLATTHAIDWEIVRWIYFVVVYAGGRGSDGTPVPTTGPLHCWRIAVYEDGEIADINWLDLVPEIPETAWTNCLMVLLDTINMCNCTNVEVAVPTRPRHQSRRLSRMGVTVSEIHVKPVSRSYRGKGTPLSQIASGPLSSVRGHYAQYGPKYNRGLLFGKYEGRFWISQHVRGVEELGVTEHEYTMKP